MERDIQNRYRYEIDKALLQDDTEPFDTLCIVAYGAILTMVILFWAYAIVMIWG